jgi:hypothetical protein
MTFLARLDRFLTVAFGATLVGLCFGLLIIDVVLK